MLDEEMVTLRIRIRLGDIPVNLFGRQCSVARTRCGPCARAGCCARSSRFLRRVRIEQARVGRSESERVVARRTAGTARRRVEEHWVGIAVSVRTGENASRSVGSAHEGRGRVLIDGESVPVQHGVQDRVLESGSFRPELRRVAEQRRRREREVRGRVCRGEIGRVGRRRSRERRGEIKERL